ncbi:NfeD family protein [Amycolatopsis sp. NPDC057786]|uniref:NfeD family protein n=1 Tax=Amycolatopsis sp. NPDC057786 TaxID=3346250 RepID=UPI00366C5F36
MDEWVIWLIFAVILGVAEIFSVTAALGVLGGAALVTAGAAVAGLPLTLQLLVFTVVSTIGVVLIRPIALRHLQRPQHAQFGFDALIGQSATVLQEVSEMEGRVRLAGEEWTARAYDPTLVIPAGAIVDVMEVKGSTVLVYPREEPWKSPPP